MLQCINLTKSFGSHTVLKNISLTAHPGQIHVLLGKSGSGKSTLLHILTQLTSPDTGKLIINPQPINTTSLQQYSTKSSLPPVGLVFQQHSLWPHLTALNNLTLAPINVLKKNTEEVVKQAHRLLKKFDLSDKAHHYPNEMSGGEQQRMAILRCLMMPYQAIALDEPSASLDPISTQEVANTLQQLKNEDNKTILVSTHDLHFAHSIADRIHYMQDGKILESGCANCLKKPKTTQLKHYLNHSGEHT